MLMAKTLFDFASPQEKKQARADAHEAKVGKMDAFFLRWNITLEGLSDARGNPISNAIAYKAMKFIEADAVQKLHNQPQDGSGNELWSVEPIPGYNITTYTAWYRIDNDTIVGGCNCQYCSMKNQTCSHLLAVLILNNLAELPRWIQGGSRMSGSPKRVRMQINQGA